MCRLLGYIGEPIILEDILLKPAHSLLVQSYQPRELREALLNADGLPIKIPIQFGVILMYPIYVGM
jgi:glutamine amidotransferase